MRMLIISNQLRFRGLLMNRRLRSALLTMASLAAAAWASLAIADTPFQADQSFGATMPAEGEAVSLKQAIASLEPTGEQFFKIEGQVTEVCQAKGCWMILVDGDSYARVMFEDYGFFVPIETSMQRTRIYGVLSEQVLSGAQADHFAQDAGAQSTLELQGEVREYSIMARSVELEDRR